MPSRQNDSDASRDDDITVEAVFKWGPWIAGLFVFVIVATSGGVLSFANLRSDVSVNTKAIERNDEASKQRHEQQQREINDLKSGKDDQQKLLVELLRKTDVFTTKVEELNATVRELKDEVKKQQVK